MPEPSRKRQGEFILQHMKRKGRSRRRRLRCAVLRRLPSVRRQAAARISAPSRLLRRSRGKAGQRPRNSEARPAQAATARPLRRRPAFSARGTASTLRRRRGSFRVRPFVDGLRGGRRRNPGEFAAEACRPRGRRRAAFLRSAFFAPRRTASSAARWPSRAANVRRETDARSGRGEPARHASRQAPGAGGAPPERAALTGRVSFPLRAFVFGAGDRARMPEAARSRSASVPVNGVVRRRRTVDGAEPGARRAARESRSPANRSVGLAELAFAPGALPHSMPAHVRLPQSRPRRRTPRSGSDRSGKKSTPAVRFATFEPAGRIEILERGRSACGGLRGPENC